MSDVIVLPERLDLSTVPAVTSALLSRPADEALMVDASQVTHFGALGLQVIMAAAIRNNGGGGTLELQGISDRVVEQLAAMGTSPEQIAETRK